MMKTSSPWTKTNLGVFSSGTTPSVPCWIHSDQRVGRAAGSSPCRRGPQPPAAGRSPGVAGGPLRPEQPAPESWAGTRSGTESTGTTNRPTIPAWSHRRVFQTEAEPRRPSAPRAQGRLLRDDPGSSAGRRPQRPLFRRGLRRCAARSNDGPPDSGRLLDGYSPNACSGAQSSGLRRRPPAEYARSKPAVAFQAPLGILLADLLRAATAGERIRLVPTGWEGHAGRPRDPAAVGTAGEGRG